MHGKKHCAKWKESEQNTPTQLDSAHMRNVQSFSAEVLIPMHTKHPCECDAFQKRSVLLPLLQFLILLLFKYITFPSDLADYDCGYAYDSDTRLRLMLRHRLNAMI